MSQFQTDERKCPYGIDLDNGLVGVLRQSREGGEEVTSSTYWSGSDQALWSLTRVQDSSSSPQMTKSIFPNFSIVFFTASLSSSGFRTSACVGIQVFPVPFDNSSAASASRSNLDTVGQPDDVEQKTESTNFLPTIAALAPCFIYGTESSSLAPNSRK